MRSVIPAFWCLSSNFGDQLSPYLIEKISGKTVCWLPPSEPVEKYVVVGSILNWDVCKGVAWGCGIANRDDQVTIADVRAVRGPLSQAAIKAMVPDVIGDPSLLLPRFYVPRKKSWIAELGIIPHYTDMYRVASWLDQQEPRSVKGVRLINILDSVEDVINAIVGCKRTISSSLHGMIASHAYGVPSAWVEFGRDVLGDGTKFHDYALSVGGESSTVNLCDDQLTLDAVMAVKTSAPVIESEMLERLYNACPFKP